MMMSQTCTDAFAVSSFLSFCFIIRDSLFLPGCRKEEDEEESPVTESGSDDDDDDDDEGGGINPSSLSVIRYFSVGSGVRFHSL